LTDAPSLHNVALAVATRDWLAPLVLTPPFVSLPVRDPARRLPAVALDGKRVLMTWDHLQRQRIIRRYRLIVRGAAPMFVGGLLITLGGIIAAITHSHYLPLMLGPLLVAASAFNLYRALTTTMKVVEIEEAERRSHTPV
jgi:hypothetical protein